MKLHKMNKSSFYIFTALFATCLLFFTGCPHSYSTANQQNDSTAEPGTIVVKGTVSAPSAMSESSRMAFSSFAQDKDGGLVIYKVIATATIDGEEKLEEAPIDISKGSSFSISLPKVEAIWSIYVQMLVNNNVFVTSQTKTLNVTEQQLYYDINEKFYLILPEQSDPTQSYGSINLTVKKAFDSSIKKIKWQLNPVGSATQTQPIVFTNTPTFDDTTLIAVLNESNIPAGTYEAQLSFMDTNGMIYGPVYELITVSAGFVTDTWYPQNQDAFIQFFPEDEKDFFTIPSDSRLTQFFSDSYYGEPITGNVVLMWNYDSQTYKPSYTVHTLDDTGYANEFGYPLAKNKDVREVFPDYSNNDMYVLTNENALYKYTASSGYSEYKVNYEGDYEILTACVNNGTAYILVYNPFVDPFAYEEYYKRYILKKFDSNNNSFEEIGYIPLEYADYPNNTDSFKMALCDNYLFVVYNSGGKQSEQGFACAAFNVTQINDYVLRSSWYDSMKYEHFYSSITAFKNKSFTINDIVAVYSGGDDVDVEDRIISAYDIYALLGYERITKAMGELDYDYASSYGGIIKIKTTVEGDNIYLPAFDTDYGYRYLYQFSEWKEVYDSDGYNANSNLYNPIKFVGKVSGEYLIADDGAVITSSEGKGHIWRIDSVTSVNRLVSVDITSSSVATFSTQTVEADFDNYTSYSEYIYYPIKAANGQQMGSSNVFIEISGNSPNILLGDGVTVELYKKTKYGYFETSPTTELPSKRGEPIYFITTPTLSNATYEAVLYCNGKDLNKDSADNELSESEQYYTVDSQTGTLTLKKPLPVIGYEYQLAIDVIVQFAVDGKTTDIHNDVTMEVYPATEFEIRFPHTLQEFHDLLDNFLIADCATVKAINNQFTVDDYEGYDYAGNVYAAGEYYVSNFVNDIVYHFNTHPCDCLILDFSDPDMTGLTEITSGMFAIDCSGIKLPVKRYNSSASVETIRSGAFYNDNTCFKGDLVIHKSLVTIESGAFKIPPRSISINNTGWTRSDSETASSVFGMGSITAHEWGDDILIQMYGNEWSKVIVCVKRDEPFEVEFKNKWTKVTEIYSNAFRGLPVISKDLENAAGQAITVGENAFADTPVED